MTVESSDTDDKTSYLDTDQVPEGGDKTPDSPAGSEVKDAEPKSALEIVESVLKTPEAPEAGESSAPEGGEVKEGETPPEAKEAGDKPVKAEGEEKPDEDAKLPFHKHPRWQEVQTELKELRPLKEKAEALDQLQGFVQETGLTPQEVDAGIQMMVVLKHGDPAKALEVLKPYYDSLTEATGSTLPDDLKKAVDEGQITEELARDLAKSRGAVKTSEVRQQRSVETATVQTTQQVGAAVTQWEAAWRGSDPDADKLIGMVKTGIENRVAKARMEGKAITPQIATKMADEALAEARETAKKFMPAKKPAVNPKTIVSETVPGTAEPKSALDAVNLALERSKAA